MDDSLVIDRIYSELVRVASSDDFGLNDLKGISWGYKSSDGYLKNKLAFARGMRLVAKSCSLKWDNSTQYYYLFDGRIYVPVREDLLVDAWDQFLEHMQLHPMVRNREMREEVFFRTLRHYNPLVHRKDVIAFRNGVLDLVDYRLYDFSPRFHVTYCHPYEFQPKARCTRWMNFLHEVLPDKNSRLILQMFLGLGLIERGTAFSPSVRKDDAKVELCLILLGSGSNGKSVIYNTAVGLFGPHNIQGADYDELTGYGDEGMRARSLLRNALFNWSTDSDSRTFGRKRTGVFKRIVSGEPVTDRVIGGNVQMNPQLPYLIFNLNELPYPEDQSLGFIRRLQFISFDVTIPKERQNPALSAELVAEYPGIFNWVLRGSRELRRRKFVFPDSEGNRRHVLMAQLQVNPVLAWVNAYQMRWDMRARNEVGVYISTDVLLRSLAQFCEDNEVDVPSKQKFGQTMARIGNGFYKRRFKEGFRYLVYGCTEERLSDSFVVGKESMRVDYIEERGTFIEEDD